VIKVTVTNLECYGLKERPKDDWKCEKCESKEKVVQHLIPFSFSFSFFFFD